MIEQIRQFINDPVKMTRVAIAGFFVAVSITAYFLFTLPNDLVYQGGMVDSGRAGGVYAELFIAVGIAFAFCYATIHYMQISKKETIVYLDKKTEGGSSQGSQVGKGEGRGSFNQNSLRDAINKGKTYEEKCQYGLNQLCDQLNAGQGALYTVSTIGDKKVLNLKSGFALVLAEGEQVPAFELGEGLIGQVAASGKSLYLDELPEGYAVRIESGLGGAPPKFLFIMPLKKENEITGVVELALFASLSEADRKQASESGSILADIS